MGTEDWGQLDVPFATLYEEVGYRVGSTSMTCYVDNMRAPFRRMLMCHMVADTEEELHDMADEIGVARKWYQGDHYDICLSKRKLAVEAGAVEVTRRELGRIVMEQRRKRACQMKTKR